MSENEPIFNPDDPQNTSDDFLPTDNEFNMSNEEPKSSDSDQNISDDFLPVDDEYFESQDESEGVISESVEMPIVEEKPRLTEYDYQEALREFEELSLSDVVGQFFRAPTATLRAFWLAIQPETRDNRSQLFDLFAPPTTSIDLESPSVEQDIAPTPVLQDSEESESLDQAATDKLKRGNWSQFIQIFCYLLSLVFATLGGAILVLNSPIRIESMELVSGFPYFVLAIIIWLVGESIGSRRAIQTWWREKRTGEKIRWVLRILPIMIILSGLGYFFDASDDSLRSAQDTLFVLGKIGQGIQIILLGVIVWLLFIAIEWLFYYIEELYPHLLPAWLIDPRKSYPQSPAYSSSETSDDLPWYMQIHPVRVFLIIFGVILCLVTWTGSSGNNFPEIFWFPWLGSVTCIAMAFAPRSWWNPLNGIGEFFGKISRFQWTRYGWVVIVVIAILFLGAKFRLDNLTGSPANDTSIPQEMTSDHVEKLLDSQRVKDGSRNIFFANNGGREPFQMYAMAIFSTLPGQGINHNSLKLLAVLESLITLPVMFWLGYELFGRENKRLGILVGLLVMAFVATSYWHVTITRLALRIVLTPLVSSLLIIYLVRAMRDNQVGDYIKAGLVLGFGLYTYQAIRMLPVVVLVGVGLALVWGYKTRRDRLTVMGNLIVLIMVSFVAFLPLYHYSVESPDQFWRRTAGRILGDDVVEEKMPDGSIRERTATFSERIDAFNQNIPVLLNNIRNAVLMFNWKGDVAWVSGVPNYPALDQYSGALFIVGIVAWCVLVIRRRDVTLPLIPIMVLIMLLPSALSIAFPIENPSLTRTSGALPATYLLVALPLALIVEHILAWNKKQWRFGASFMLCLIPIVGSFGLNYDLYMTRFAESYASSSLPYSDAGRVLQGFAISDGTYGNAFLVGFPNWYDHRAVGIAGGIEGRWPNGVFDTNLSDEYPDWVDYVPKFMEDAYNTVGIFHLDPNRDLLFFYSPEDTATSEQLKIWFPSGRELEYPAYQTGKNFMTYRVPALGDVGYQEFMAQHPIPR